MDAELGARGGRAGGCGIGGDGNEPGRSADRGSLLRPRHGVRRSGDHRSRRGTGRRSGRQAWGKSRCGGIAGVRSGPGRNGAGHVVEVSLERTDPGGEPIAVGTQDAHGVSEPARFAIGNGRWRRARSDGRVAEGQTMGAGFGISHHHGGRDAKDRHAAPGAEPPRFTRDRCPRSFVIALASCHRLQPRSRISLKTLAESGDPDARAGGRRASTAVALPL